MSERIPAEVFPPGELLSEELQARGWSRRQLAERMGSDTAVNELAVDMLIELARIEPLIRVGPIMAGQLAAALGTSPDFWLNLDAAWEAANPTPPAPTAATTRGRG